MANKDVKKIALICLGGTGERFGSKSPKQFVNIGQKPLLYYAVDAFNRCPEITDIVLVCLSGTGTLTLSLCNKAHFTKVAGIVSGGSSRRESVLKGLRFILGEGIGKENDIVLIADGDRPLVSQSIIIENIKAVEKYGAAVTAISSSDSIIHSSFGYEVGEYLPRKMIFLAQTPQSFRLGEIADAHEMASKKKDKDYYTDDASIYKAFNKGTIRIVPGEKKNIKITEKVDADIFLAIKEGL